MCQRPRRDAAGEDTVRETEFASYVVGQGFQLDFVLEKRLIARNLATECNSWAEWSA